ncbi:MAG: hypothetical protein A4E49_01221 [Methanosaeta sp. PtaU1.Bin112]|nr:MAG: hypothetical protein A4E49_01221 [Methanosaeta sp. PtaU1.Bin112]
MIGENEVSETTIIACPFCKKILQENSQQQVKIFSY